MPKNPTPAQSAASRANTSRSTGPITAEGNVRAAQNARTFGLRSARLSLLPDEDHTAFDLLEASIHEHFQPRTPLEAALCARMVTALWRTERAEALERSFWIGLPDRVERGHAMTENCEHHELHERTQDSGQPRSRGGAGRRGIDDLHERTQDLASWLTFASGSSAFAEDDGMGFCTNEPKRHRPSGIYTNEPEPPPSCHPPT